MPDTFLATISGGIHPDFLAAGQIGNPFLCDHELRQLWIGEPDWGYARTVFISAIEFPERGEVEVHVMNDRPETVTGVMTWILTDTAGTQLAANTLDCRIPAETERKLLGVQFRDHLNEYSPRRLLLWLELRVQGQLVAQRLSFFTHPKQLELRDPGLSTHVRQLEESGFEVQIAARYPALWVWPDLPGVSAVYSQRFFHLRPGQPVTVTIRPEQQVSRAELSANLCVYSAVDIWKL